jgi:thioester reductase-like protein
MADGGAEELEPVAIIGMACQVPGARTPEEFWRNMRDGVESITRFSPDELRAAGIDEDTLADPDYVPAAGYLPDADAFDADFFGFNKAEAQTMDPQQRVFCETAWTAAENSGHRPDGFSGTVGVFAGTFMNKYLMLNLGTNARFQRSPMAPLARMFNDKDFLATRVAHLLGLTGPACTVQTACSTSLVAAHLGCQSLLSYECDVALVGGVSINLPLKSGYPVADSGLFSADGHCRPFDARSAGTVPGNGAVVLVLRRLGDALADRDRVYAVIRGSAVNNDGSVKAGFAAPSVDGQARAITAALAVAGADPATIGYVEAHGTATRVGDPIEVAALAHAFGRQEPRRCALGSVKANIGHLDAAAGAAGLMRAALAVYHGQIPPTANFAAPNPELRLEQTPFYVPAAAADWCPDGHPRRAAVSSFGVGGTNAHMVLEEAPPGPEAGDAGATARQWQLIPLSARTRTALDAATERLAGFLGRDGDDAALADVAFTLQEGRRVFGLRRFAVCSDRQDAAAALGGADPRRLVTRPAPDGPAEAVFAFPGGGSQHPDMGLDIYRSEPIFRAEVDRCAELLLPRLGFDLRRLLFPAAFRPLEGRGLAGGAATMGRDQGASTVSALFVVEYAMARQLMAWGVRPAAMIGHSLGEYVAACLAGVFSLPDALEITLARGELFEAMPPGRMLVIALPEERVAAMLPERVSISAVNAPELTVVAGPDEDIAAALRQLRARGIDCRKLSVPVASHTWMVEPYLDEFTAKIKKLDLSAPRLPFVSSVTGTWIGDEATDPGYWARHLREPVRFSAGVRTVLAAPGRLLLEVGPGKALSSLAAAQQLAPVPITIPTMGLPRDPMPDLAHLVSAIGRLWQAGVPVDWRAFHAPAAPRRVPLPAYPFERQRYWIEALSPGIGAAGSLPGEPADTEKAAGPAEAGAGEGFAAPRTELERQVARIWQELLGVDRVGVDEDFFDLGAHSLMVTQIARDLRRMGATELSARDVLGSPTVAGMAALVERALHGGPKAPAQAVALADEVVLNEAIRAGGLALPGPEQPSTVLLTGATGFVGAFLCAELLRQTPATVLCLVRAADAAQAEERVRANLERYGLAEAANERIGVIVGDLARPLLGLDQALFADLAERADEIYHCGAWVNFVRPYRALKAANVQGTQEILRLAATCRLKPVHYVSTLAVLAGAMTGETDRIGEDDPLPPPVGHDTAYSQSKWVAEGLIDIARQRGIPVSVYRAGGVLADSRTGAGNRDDYVTKVIQGCVQLGLAPLRDYRLSVGTVDHLARLVVGLARHPEARGRAFHTIDPLPLAWNEIFDQLRRCGYPVQSVPFEQWRQRLTEQVDSDGDDNALAPLMAMIGETPDRHMPDISCANVLSVLGAQEASAPPLDTAFFERMLGFFVHERLLPQPARPFAPRG